MSRQEDWIWFWGEDELGAKRVVDMYGNDGLMGGGTLDEQTYELVQHERMRLIMRIVQKLRVLEGRLDDLDESHKEEGDCPHDHPFVDEVKADVEKWAEGMKKKPE